VIQVPLCCIQQCHCADCVLFYRIPRHSIVFNRIQSYSIVFNRIQPSATLQLHTCCLWRVLLLRCRVSVKNVACISTAFCDSSRCRWRSIRVTIQPNCAPRFLLSAPAPAPDDTSGHLSEGRYRAAIRSHVRFETQAFTNRSRGR
jgi:hypothetical protein